MSSRYPSIEAVERLAEEGESLLRPETVRINMPMSTCARAAGAAEVLSALKRSLAQHSTEAVVIETGCMGLCWAEPLVEVCFPDGSPSVLLGNLAPEDAEHVALWVGERLRSPSSQLPRRLAGKALGVAELSAWDGPQCKRLMGDWGRIDPGSAEEYAATGGFKALARVLEQGDPWALIDTVESSGLRGRGGAGYPTGKKMRSTRDSLESQDRSTAPSPSPAYVIANGDEGDPGAYMDRGLMESSPFLLIEGMAICAYAVGADRGYVFTRREYPLAARCVEAAIERCRELGLLGDDIMGSGFSFDVSVICSAGSYVCGESSVLLQALEGKPIHPRRRPPHATESGLWGRPTCICNVETLANLPGIVLHGADWFKEQGTETSPGTKIFSLTGAVKRNGLIELPMGTPVLEVVDAIGLHKDAGTSLEQQASALPKAVQVGGPSGALFPPGAEGLTLDYEGLASVGGIIGSGGIVALDSSACIVDIVRYFLAFSACESCGFCAPCRKDLPRCVELLEGLTQGSGSGQTIEELRELGEHLSQHAFCGLGKMAPRVLLSALDQFGQEFEEHAQGRCTALSCQELVRYEIIAERCQGERCCLTTCAGNAIKGPFGKPGRILDRLCVKCGSCLATCPYGAVKVSS